MRLFFIRVCLIFYSLLNPKILSCIIGTPNFLDDGIVCAQYQNSFDKKVNEIEKDFEEKKKFFLNCMQNQKKLDIAQAKEFVRKKMNLSKRKAKKFDKEINAKLKRSRQCLTGRDFLESQYVSKNEKLRSNISKDILPRSSCEEASVDGPMDTHKIVAPEPPMISQSLTQLENADWPQPSHKFMPAQPQMNDTRIENSSSLNLTSVNQSTRGSVIYLLIFFKTFLG